MMRVSGVHSAIGCYSEFSRPSLNPGSPSRLMGNAEKQFFNPSDQSGEVEFWHCLCNQTSLGLPWVNVVDSWMWGSNARTERLRDACAGQALNLLFSPTAGHWGPAERRGKGGRADQRENQAADASRRRKFKQGFYSQHSNVLISLLNL